MLVVVCEKREGGGGHCWHRTSMATYTTNPPQWDEQCCHCGRVERIHAPYYDTFTTPGHGPHAPKTWIVNG